MDTADVTKQAMLEFVCSHELYESFNVLSSDPNIEQCLTDQPLFILFHITKIKNFLNQHSANPNSNVLANNLDALLQSLCYLIRKFQPNHIQTQSSNNENMEPIDTSYSSIFYRLHQSLKIHAILSCTKSQTTKTNLINTNFKLNPDEFNFRHLDITKDIAANNDIEFDIIDIIEVLGSINKKTKKNQDKIEKFKQSHSFDAFQSELFEFLDKMQSLYCNSMSDLLYKVAERMLAKSIEHNAKHQDMNKEQYLSKMQYFSQPPAPKSAKPKVEHNKNKKLSDSNPKKRQYEIGMNVLCKVKNQTDPSSFSWKRGQIISMKRGKIKCSIDGMSVHMNFGNMANIKLIDDCAPDDDDDDVVMIDKAANDRQLRPKQNVNYHGHHSMQYERGRRFWNDEEDEALRAGMIKYKNILNVKTKGVKGIWSKIKEDDQKLASPKLRHRTTKMLYDRYRVYVKKNLLPTQCIQTE